MAKLTLKQLTDPTPVSPERLTELGFYQNENDMVGVVRLGPITTWPEFNNREGDRRWLYAAKPLRQDSMLGQIFPAPRTMGEVRQLIERFGILSNETVD